MRRDSDSLRRGSPQPGRARARVAEAPAAAGWALWLGVLAVALGIAAGPALGAPAVEPRVAFDRPVVAAGDGPVVVHLRVEFAVAPPRDLDEARRPPLNLALVLDRSGSMEEARKIEYLREAAVIAVDRLTPRDRIAVVEYDDKITVLWKSQPAQELGALKRMIRALDPRGSTDLAGGLVAGIAEARPHAGSDRVSRVILMTDGLANHGITDPGEIRRIARDAKSKGVRIATIGLGLDFNEQLLQGIAETGGGTYYYVESPRQMARIFDQELKALSTTVAKDCILRIDTGNAVRGVTVLGLASRRDGSETVIDLEDFYAGEQRALLLRLELDPAQAPGPVTLGNLRLSYQEIGSEGSAGTARQEVAAPLAIAVAADPAEAEAAVNAEVAAQATLATANEVQAEALAKYEAGQADAAAKMLQDLAVSLTAQNTTLNDRGLAAKVEALEVDRRRMETAPAPAAPAAQAMAKAMRAQNYGMARGKSVGLMLQQGDQGPEVARLVEALARAGVFKGRVQDEFDASIAAAVRAYQSQEGLAADGVAGPATLNRLGLY